MRSPLMARVLAAAVVLSLAWAVQGLAAPGEPQAGGVIHVATNAEPGTLDWQSSTATATRLVAWHVFEGLFALDRNYEVKPLLAERYWLSPDELRYTIRLRPRIKFQNGKPVTPEDVIASLERWGKLSSGGRETFKFIKQVKKVDEVTIEIDLVRVFTPLITNLGDPKQAAVIMPRSVVESSGLQPSGELIGTGPYIFKRWTPGQEIVLARNPAYASRSEDWGGLTGRKVAYADEIDFFPVTDPQVRLAGVSTGQYDLALELPQDLYTNVKANSHLAVDIVGVFSWTGAVFNKARGPFTDERLRQAALYAMKPVDLMTAAIGPQEFWRLSPGLFFPEQGGLYSTAGSEIYNHQNLAKARALMKEAGYHGQTIVLMSTKDSSWNNNAAQVLAPELQAVGFNVDSQVYDWPTLLSRRTKQDLWDIFLTGFSPSIDPTAVIFFGSTWPGWYQSAAMDELLSQWAKTPVTDSGARKTLMDKIQVLFYKEVPVAKIGDYFGLEVYNNQHLHGYTSYFDVRFWNTWVTR